MRSLTALVITPLLQIVVKKTLLYNVTGRTLVTYRECRLRGDRNIPFTLNDCPTGRVINIQSARIGFSQHQQCQSWVNASCQRSIIDRNEITACNGKHQCIFNTTVLRYRQGSVTQRSSGNTCNNRAYGNFVWITYNCISGKRQRSFSQIPLMWSCSTSGL